MKVCTHGWHGLGECPECLKETRDAPCRAPATEKPRHFFSLTEKRIISTTGDGSVGSGLRSLVWTQNVARGVAIEIGDIGEITKAIHYPECWDTMAYPTLASAVCEISHCDPEQCSHPSNGTDERPEMAND